MPRRAFLEVGEIVEIFAGLTLCFLLLTALLVVVKTFAIWRRTRGLPELLLSLYLTGATVLGYPLLISSTRIPPDQMWPLHFSGQLVTSMGFVSLLLFTLTVFRRDALWAKCLVGLCFAVLAGGTGIYYMELTGENPRPASELISLNVLNSSPIAVAYFWTTIEALSYHRRLRMRQSLGLADEAVVNRVLLWGLMTLAAGLAVVISLTGILMGSFLTTPMVLVLSTLGIAHALCLLLAFDPPGWYKAWLEGRAASEGR